MSDAIKDSRRASICFVAEIGYDINLEVENDMVVNKRDLSQELCNVLMERKNSIQGSEFVSGIWRSEWTTNPKAQ